MAVLVLHLEGREQQALAAKVKVLHIEPRRLRDAAAERGRQPEQEEVVRAEAALDMVKPEPPLLPRERVRLPEGESLAREPTGNRLFRGKAVSRWERFFKVWVAFRRAFGSK